MLRGVFLALIAFVSGAVLCSAQAATSPQTGSISGTVTNQAGEPVKNATLTLQGQPAGLATGALVSMPHGYSASSDTQGNFAFEDLEPGRYTLSSQRTGYLRFNYAAGPAGSNPSLDLSSGQKITGIAIKMTPQALISGRITDEDGEPYPNARVTASHWAWVEGQKRLIQSGSVTSDAEGGFAIGNLSAGAYYIGADPQQAIYRNTIQKGAEETYMTTYYPGVTDSASASAVQVAAGAAARGTEIRLRKARAYRVRGKVVDVTGEAVPNGNLLLTPKDGPNLAGMGHPVQASNGVFDIGNVVPGVYFLEAMPFTSVAGDGTRTEHTGMARQMVSVGNSDIDDLVVRLRPGAEITGKVSIEGSAPPQPHTDGFGTNVRPMVRLISTEGQLFGNAQLKDDETFVIRNLMPAVYRVEVAPLAPGTYVKSIRFGGLDLLKAPLDLTGGGGGALDVILSPNSGDIGGIVHGADGMPLAGAAVSLWTPGAPVEAANDFTRTIRTDAGGQFKFTSLPPGNYRVAAWEQIDPGLSVAPEFRSKFEDKALAVKLEENAHESVEAPLIGRDAIEAEAAKLQ